MTLAAIWLATGFVLMLFEVTLIPMGILAAGVCLGPTAYFCWITESQKARLCLAAHFILLGVILFFAIRTSLNSPDRSNQRLLALYLFMGFIFLSVAGPTVYLEMAKKKEENG